MFSFAWTSENIAQLELLRAWAAVVDTRGKAVYQPLPQHFKDTESLSREDHGPL